MSNKAKVLIIVGASILIIGGVAVWYFNHWGIESVKQDEGDFVKIKLSNNQEYLVEMNSGYFDVGSGYKLNTYGCVIELMKGSRIVDTQTFNCFKYR
jgi:hypothetical protein